MRVTISGSRYDTEKAQIVAQRSRRGPHCWFRETLYRSPRGRYFLHGAGGRDSLWGRWAPTGERFDGEGIRPLTNYAAKQWLTQVKKVVK